MSLISWPILMNKNCKKMFLGNPNMLLRLGPRRKDLVCDVTDPWTIQHYTSSCITSSVKGVASLISPHPTRKPSEVSCIDLINSSTLGNRFQFLILFYYFPLTLKHLPLRRNTIFCCSCYLIWQTLI